MRPPRLPWLACSVAVCLALLTATPATLAQDADEAAVCGVLTADEVGQALGTAVGTGIGWTYEGYATCNWIATDPASFAYADAEWQDVALEQIVGGVPGGVELTVGGQPAYLAPDIGALFIRLDAGLLTLSMEAASPDIDVQAALTALGEAAVPRADSLPEPVPSDPTSNRRWCLRPTRSRRPSAPCSRPRRSARSSGRRSRRPARSRVAHGPRPRSTVRSRRPRQAGSLARSRSSGTSGPTAAT